MEAKLPQRRPKPPETPKRSAFVVLGDLHATLDPPKSRTAESYRYDLEQAVEAAYLAARQARAAAVVCTGDVFHRKADASHGDVRWVMSLFSPIVREFGPVRVVRGNHDMQGDNLAHTLTEQPLGVLLQSGTMRLLDEYPEVFRDPEGRSTVLMGVSYRRSLKDAVDALAADAMIALSRHDAADFAIAIVHADALPDSKFAKHAIVAAGVGGMLAQSVMVVNGHLHDSRAHGLHSLKCRGMSIHGRYQNVGSAVRVSRAEANLRPRLAVIADEGGNDLAVRFIEPKFIPVGTAFTDEQEPTAPTAPGSSADLRAMISTMRRQGDRGPDPVRVVEATAKERGDDRSVVDRAVAIVREVEA